jgi:hypothetical protein
MAMLIKILVKKPEEDWSGLIRGWKIPKSDNLSAVANAHQHLVESMNMTSFSSAEHSNNVWRFTYGFPSMTDLVSFVNQYLDKDETKEWKTKIMEKVEREGLPLYQKTVVILDDNGNQVQNSELFANTDISKI